MTFYAIIPKEFGRAIIIFARNNMFHNDTDKEWEKFGKNDPYYGVLTKDEFRSKNLTEELKKEFFATGSSYINDLLDKIKRHIDKDFQIRKALDFGCGVGRLVIPLAEISQEVTLVMQKSLGWPDKRNRGG
jgi:2-polyprenyl-3-methyl-5-hydroxy-6-metoxy-1,4-benzoquinol methylase